MSGWMDRGACRNAPDKSIFFSASKRIQKRARTLYCGPCPVRRECLDFALNGEEQGIWGGTTDYARERMTLTAVAS